MNKPEAQKVFNSLHETFLCSCGLPDCSTALEVHHQAQGPVVTAKRGDGEVSIVHLTWTQAQRLEQALRYNPF